MNRQQRRARRLAKRAPQPPRECQPIVAPGDDGGECSVCRFVDTIASHPDCPLTACEVAELWRLLHRALVPDPAGWS